MFVGYLLSHSEMLMPIATLLKAFATCRQDDQPGFPDLQGDGCSQPAGNMLSTGTSMVLVISMMAASAHACAINDQLSTDDVLASAVQCQEVSNAPGLGDTRQGALPFQPEPDFWPAETDELFLRPGFAAGNGVNGRTPFVIVPWSAGLKDDVENINGTTPGIINTTDYLNKNARASDEYTRFMYSALTNGPNVFLPPCDADIALAWNTGH